MLVLLDRFEEGMRTIYTHTLMIRFSFSDLFFVYTCAATLHCRTLTGPDTMYLSILLYAYQHEFV